MPRYPGSALSRWPSLAIGETRGRQSQLAMRGRPMTSPARATVVVMPSDDTVSQLERELETVERSMSAVGALSAQQAERVAERVDRLASQLLEITTPEPWDAVHARLGTTPASSEDFAALTDELASPDGEG